MRYGDKIFYFFGKGVKSACALFAIPTTQLGKITPPRARRPQRGFIYYFLLSIFYLGRGKGCFLNGKKTAGLSMSIIK
jgi:hypothetical protein